MRLTKQDVIIALLATHTGDLYFVHSSIQDHLAFFGIAMLGILYFLGRWNRRPVR